MKVCTLLHAHLLILEPVIRNTSQSERINTIPENLNPQPFALLHRKRSTANIGV